MDRKDYYLTYRANSGVWYYRLRNDRRYRSTGVRGKSAASRGRAEQWVRNNRLGKGPASQRTFRDYAEPFFDWERCPRIRRLLQEQKRIGKTHARTSRLQLHKYIYPDPFADFLMGDIRRGDVVDLRDRLLQSCHPATVHKTLSAVKAVFSEAFYREDIATNPGAKVGAVNYAKRERGTFTKAELTQLFTEVPGVWEQFLGYCVFNTAARTGMRAGELLALKWDAIDFNAGTIDIHRAWQGSELADQVKSLKRVIPVAASVMESLATLHEEGIRVGENDLVFCHEYNGRRLGDTWWHKRFVKAVESFGIDNKERNITGHSLRHSLHTHLLSLGASEAKLRGYFGWSERSQGGVLTPVQAGYTHWQADDMRELVPLVDEVFSG